jgi:hypothetical protein
MLKFVIIIFSVLFSGVAIGQELRCNVSVSSSRMEGSNKQVYKSMREDIHEFMNNRKWTEHVYDESERIECNIFIQIKEQSGNRFKGSIQVQARRPVYNSSYETTIINLKDDDFEISYVEFEPMEYNESSNSNPLTNILAYYAYIIIGFDYDTFSKQGGSEYFQKAQSIVSRSQGGREKGWRAFEGSFNRFWLVENVLNRSYASFRDLMYRYHRLGLDMMSERPDMARAGMSEALMNMQKIYRSKPDTYINRIFWDAKSNEIVDVFKSGTTDEKNRILAVLSECDPSNSGKYEKIRQRNNPIEP